ncbi:contractile injection system tape measure protein [Portibacter lacus]|uniref:Uncharacterized protein n=1 Tax=Portibacter lacus TaxID=1099794 RepID=A0AA37SPX8_9BACT|nr:contractile injection system tape measure protein [Portibacter lacus]GLR16716.1 hypothetical protein GCM10007940_13310 [Portibacter lacus]
MASKEKLTIHKLVFNIQVADKDAFKHFADRFSKLCNRTLPNRLDKILEKHKIPNGRLIIKKLNIDLGEIPQHSFEKVIADAITKEFDKYLKKYIAEITEQITTAKFSTSAGGRITVNTSLFDFESEIYINRSVDISRQIQDPAILDKSYIPAILEKKPKAQKQLLKPPSVDAIPEDITSLIEAINQAGKKVTPKDPGAETTSKALVQDETVSIKTSTETKQIVPTTRALTKAIKQADEKQIVALLQAQSTIPADKKLKAIQFLKEIPADLPPKTLTDLEKVFLYHIRYGRLPSNIKYELGMQMLDILNINQLDVRFFEDLKKHIDRDERAKERLIRLTDKANKASLIKKQILKTRELEQFDPRIPKSFEDYFTALMLGRDLDTFSPEMRRYNLNDMIRFFYADHPQKLRAIIKFLLVDYPSQESTKDRLHKFFGQIGKSSIVKIIGSYVRKAGYVNKALNNLNKDSERGIKDAHEAVLLAFLLGENPVEKLKDSGFKDLLGKDEDLNIMPRVFLSEEPTYKVEKYENQDLVDYYLRYGTLPHSSSTDVISLDKLSISILMLSGEQIKKIPYFRDRMFEQNLKQTAVGQISMKALEHILEALVPDRAKDVISKFNYFRINIKSGVPESFQKSFLMHYALKSSPRSYLEEMVQYWKKEFGDADEIIKRRWNVNEELGKELNKLLYIKKETLAEQIKVDPEFENYSQDISVKNAGLVIVWPFLKVYFNMLDLLNAKGDFRSKDERARACHLLQYLAVKQSGGEEFYYPLNKILTGYPLDEPLPYEITMTQKEIDVSNALLKNIVKQWNALKGSSVDALRGSFLIRDGIIVPAPNGWLLTVEKKAYDILLDKLPWGIGMIKLSWAPYVLSVEWDRNIM